MNKHLSLKYFCLTRISLQFYGILTGLLAIPYISFAEAPKIAFEENKNQWPSQVMYKADIKGGRLFLEKNTFTYAFMEQRAFHHEGIDPQDTSKIKFHSFKANFENSNPDVEVSGSNLLEGHRNYYRGNDPKKWAENVKVYTRVNYRSLYPSIDVNVYNEEENLKYDFIVHPGGNARNIKINYTGPDKMHLEYGHLYIQTSVGLIIEQKPYAYQDINGIKKQIACAYVLRNNTLSFDVGNYDASLPLIIDPTLIGSTFTGSTSDNRGYTATYDAAGNMYTGGRVWAQGYPVTAGSWDQTANAMAGWDIVLSKFNTNASTLLFSTYYGGTSDQQPHSIIVNNSNQLYVAGRTNSTDFPVTGGVFQPALGGAYDIIVGKFSATGALLASTYLGGSADDAVNVAIGSAGWFTLKYSWGDDGRSEIILDNTGNVYIASNTHSTNFPTSALAYDKLLSGTQDAVICKMNSTLTTLMYSTYLGGSGEDAGYGLKLDNTNKIYVTGGTTSADFPIPVAGVIKPTFGGGVDGFIAVFNPALSGAAQLTRSTFLGTPLYDQSYLIEIDASGDLYVYGQTAGAYPVTAGVYTNPNSGMFIHKIRGSLASTVFSTVIGSGANNINISPTAFLVDSCQTIYISGWGRCNGPWGFPFPGSTTGMPVTANAFQGTTDGCDAYFMVLEPDAKGLFYASFFGENSATPDHVDGGTSRFDKRGVIYQTICAGCGGGSGFPTTPTAYSTTNKALDQSRCNNAIVKMDVGVNPIAKANITSATKGCAPFTVTFNNTGSNADHYIWDFGDGGTSVLPSPSYTYSYAGTYSITLFAIDSIGICGYIDTSIVVVKVGKAPALVTTASKILCNGIASTATVSATGGIPPYTYAWSLSGGSASTANLNAGNYTITVTDAAGCASTKTLTISQPPPLTIAATTSVATCSVSNGSATATVGGGTPGYTYSWSSSQTTTAITGMNSGAYTITVTDKNGCTKTQAVTIGVANGPTVNATATGSITCNGGNTGAAASSTTGGTAPYTYQWSPGMAGTNQNASGLTGGTYFLVVIDSKGCIGLDSVNIAEPNPIMIGMTTTAVACFGGNNGMATASVTGGSSPYTYAWGTSPVKTTKTITGMIAGTYSVLVTDSKGCTNTASVTIGQSGGSLTINTSISGSGCGTTSTAIINSSVANGTPNYTYNWMPGGQTTANISNVLGGTYTVIVTDKNNCTASNIVTMPTAVQPLANFSYTSAISCEGITLQFTDSSVNALSWLWDFGGTGSSTEQHPGYIFPYSGNYTVTLIVANPPCKDTLSVPVVIGDIGSGITFSDANVFTPNKDGINDCFHPAMINSATGLPDNILLQCTYLEVFDRWGVKMYESFGLNGLNCWDGNNKNDSKPAQDGTYYYIAELGNTLIKGYVTLARNK